MIHNKNTNVLLKRIILQCKAVMGQQFDECLLWGLQGPSKGSILLLKARVELIQTFSRIWLATDHVTT